MRMRGGRAASLVVVLVHVVLLLLVLVGGTAALRLCSSSECESSSPSTNSAAAVLLLPSVLRDDYPKVNRSLDLIGLTPDDYSAFIAELRRMVASTDQVFLSIPVVRRRVPLSERFVLVDIRNEVEEAAVTLAIDVTNVYVVGYLAGNAAFFLRPDDNDTDTAEAIDHRLFPNATRRRNFTFTGSYPALQAAAGYNREDIPLGRAALERAVRSMNQYARTPTPLMRPAVARSLIVCIQMVSEAARFRYVEYEMRRRIQRNEETAPDASVLHIVNQWSSLSTAIQESMTRDGVFGDGTVRLRRRDYSFVTVPNVQAAVALMGILAYFNSQPRRPGPGPAAAPAVRIQGTDGLCVTVKDGDYNNGDDVLLLPCRWEDDDGPHQLWTFRADDGTLRSNGMCLASYGYTSGDYIMVYECRPDVDAFIWHWWPNGTIASASGLVLTANSSRPGTLLAAQRNAYSTGQSWLPVPAADAPAPARQIAGPSGLCLHAVGGDDGEVLLRECAGMEAGSWWVLYPDSSIRRAGGQGRGDDGEKACLAASGVHPEQPLRTVDCDPNSPLQRWLFGSDGAIANVGTQLVVDVLGGSADAVPGDRLTLNVPAGTATQQWQGLL